VKLAGAATKNLPVPPPPPHPKPCATGGIESAGNQQFNKRYSLILFSSELLLYLLLNPDTDGLYPFPPLHPGLMNFRKQDLYGSFYASVNLASTNVYYNIRRCHVMGKTERHLSNKKELTDLKKSQF
jgi:hypothetical protein